MSVASVRQFELTQPSEGTSSFRSATFGRRDRAAVILSGVIVSLIVLNAVPAVVRPTEFFQDDSYFYTQIASNIVAGRGSTFHGVTPTNGYHPLWMAGAVVSLWLAQGDKNLAIHVVSVIQVLMAIVAALLFTRLTRAMELRSGMLGMALIVSFLLATSVFGSEAHLNAVMLTAALVWLLRAFTDDHGWTWFTAGVLLGLAILARLDNLFVVAAVASFSITHEYGLSRRSIVRRAGFGAIGGTVVLLPYLIWNIVEYGHLTPISGAIKSTFPAFALDPNRLGTLGKLTAAFGIASLLVGQFFDRNERRRVLWRGLGGGVLMHAVYVAGFTDHYTFWPWYYVSGVIAAGLIVTYVADVVLAQMSHWSLRFTTPYVIALLTIAALCVSVVRSSLKAFNPRQIGLVTADLAVNEYRWNEELGRWMKGHMPSDAGIFAEDFPGALAYYSDRVVVPMDGLVNDFHYNDALLAMGPMAYLCAHHVQFFFGSIDDGATTWNVEVEVQAPLYRKTAGTLFLHEQDLVMRARDAASRPDRTPPFAIWRLRCPA